MSGSLRYRAFTAAAFWLAAAAPVAGLDCEAPGQAGRVLRRTGSLWLGEVCGTREAAALIEQPVAIAALNLTQSGGSAWICTGGSAADGGPRRLAGSEAPIGLELSVGGRDENCNGR